MALGQRAVAFVPVRAVSPHRRPDADLLPFISAARARRAGDFSCFFFGALTSAASPKASACATVYSSLLTAQALERPQRLFPESLDIDIEAWIRIGYPEVWALLESASVLDFPCSVCPFLSQCAVFLDMERLGAVSVGKSPLVMAGAVVLALSRLVNQTEHQNSGPDRADQVLTGLLLDLNEFGLVSIAFASMPVEVPKVDRTVLSRFDVALRLTRLEHASGPSETK